jgi:hypothetical protein
MKGVPLVPLPYNPREDSCLKLADNDITEDALSEELKCEITGVLRVSMWNKSTTRTGKRTEWRQD